MTAALYTFIGIVLWKLEGNTLLTAVQARKMNASFQRRAVSDMGALTTMSLL